MKKNILITGASRGIGAATALLAAKEDYAVAVNYRADKNAADAIVSRIVEAGGSAVAIQADISEPDDVVRLFSEMDRLLGRIDALVNNAAVTHFAPLEELQADDIDRVLSINVKGAMLGLKHVGKVMLDAGRGAIVNISSVDGFRGANTLALYSSSKWAVRGLTKTAALEFGPRGVRVNSVHPGGVDTAMGNPQGQTGEERNWAYGRVPLQRIGEPHEIAAASVFLCSDDASYIAGAELAVDGGWAAGYYHSYLPGAPAAIAGTN